MPQAAPKTCSCGGIVRKDICDRCGPRRTRSHHASDYRHLYRSYRWRKYSKDFRNRRENALCAICQAAGRVTATECVDHIIPHKGDEVLFWDPANHQPACRRCNSLKDQHGSR